MIEEITQSSSVDRLEEALLSNPEGIMGKELERICDLKHHFAPGVYVRECTVPAGMAVVGHKHKHRHINVVIKGLAWMVGPEDKPQLVGSGVFVTEPGVRKAVIALEDFTILNIHPTEETDLELIEEQTIEKSEAYMEMQDLIAKVNELTGGEA